MSTSDGLPTGSERETDIEVFVDPEDLAVLREYKDEGRSYPLSVNAYPQRPSDVAVRLAASPPEASEEPEDDFDNPTYLGGWQDAKADSVDPRSKRPCPGCLRGDVPVLLDDDGTLCSISGEPGRFGHGQDDAWWYCEDFAGPVPPVEPEGGERP